MSADMYGGQNQKAGRAFRAQPASRITRTTRGQTKRLQLGGMLTPQLWRVYPRLQLPGIQQRHLRVGTLFTLWQRGLPMDGGWFGNNALAFSTLPARIWRGNSIASTCQPFPLSARRPSGDERQPAVECSVGEPGLYGITPQLRRPRRSRRHRGFGIASPAMGSRC